MLLVFVLTITIKANIVVPPGDNIHSYYGTTVTKNCCAPGLIGCALRLKYLDTPVCVCVCTVVVDE